MIGFLFGLFMIMLLCKGIFWAMESPKKERYVNEEMHQEDLKEFIVWAMDPAAVEMTDNEELNVKSILYAYNAKHPELYVPYRGSFQECFEEMYGNWIDTLKK